MYCEPPNQNFGWAIAHPTHAGERGYRFAHPTRRPQPSLMNPPLRPQNSSQPFSSYSELFVESRQFQPTTTAFGVFIGGDPV